MFEIVVSLAGDWNAFPIGFSLFSFSDTVVREDLKVLEGISGNRCGPGGRGYWHV